MDVVRAILAHVVVAVEVGDAARYDPDGQNEEANPVRPAHRPDRRLGVGEVRIPHAAPRAHRGFAPPDELPVLAALSEVGHLVLELLEGGLEGLMLALPKVPALAEEPNQRARSAPAVLGCPLWSPSRRLAGKGSVHACLLLPHPWEHPKLAPAQQKKQNLARSNWQSRSTFHGASVTPSRLLVGRRAGLVAPVDLRTLAGCPPLDRR